MPTSSRKTGRIRLSLVLCWSFLLCPAKARPDEMNSCVNALGMLRFFHDPASLSDEERMVVRQQLKEKYPEIPPLTGLIRDQTADRHNQVILGQLAELAHSADASPAISSQLAQTLLDEVQKNPVASFENKAKYDPHHLGIGFCYGRAHAVRCTAQEHDVPDSSIRKVFLIGEFRTKDHGPWGFHTTTAIRGDNPEGWWFLDPFFDHPVLPSEWLHYWTQVGGRENDDTGLLVVANPDQLTIDPKATLEKALARSDVGPYFRDLKETFPRQRGTTR